MEKSQSNKLRTLPSWLAWLFSIPLLAHLMAVFVLPLSAQSGLWPTPYGQDMAMGPQFAAAISLITTDKYLVHLGMAHNHHFESNRTEQNDVFFEVRLKKDGKTVETLNFPPEAGDFWLGKLDFWGRHRQKLLAQALGNDMPVRQREAERIGPANQQTALASYWLMPEEIRKLARENILDEALANIDEPAGGDKNHFVFVTVPDTQDGAVRSAANNRPMARPSPWSMVLVRSYLRYLCRREKADSAELIRHSREPISPVMLYMTRKPQEGSAEMVAHFGDLRDEQ